MARELDGLTAAVIGPGPGPAVAVAAALAGPLAERLRAEGWLVHRVDRAPVFSKETLLHALYQAGRFPAWFGFSWDALLDCLSDWSWAPARGHALLFHDLALLERRAPEVARTFLEIVSDARGRGAPLRVVRLLPADD